MRWLIRLYPREWRRRYGADMAAHLAQTGGGWRDALDLARGARDARLNPQWPDRRQAWRLPPAAALLAVLAAVLLVELSAWLARPLGSYLLVDLGLAAAGAAAAVLGWLAGSRLLAWLAGLLALRLLGDGVALSLLAGGWPHSLLLDVLELALWTAAAALVLRRARVPWLAGLAVGCALELLLTSPDLSLAAVVSHGLGWPGLGAPAGRTLVSLPVSPLAVLRLSLWAAALATVVAWRRRFGEPPTGAGVPARPLPDAPRSVSAEIEL